MIKNYLKVAIRNLVKYKVFSFINVLGLATGVAVCLLVMLYVSDELSWDRHFSDSENIYRVGLHGRLGEQELIDPITPPPMAAALIAEIPGVVSATRLQNPGFPVLRYEEKVFSEEGFAWADSNFFNVFQLQLLRGDPKTVLRHPNHLVITESVAKRYFGDDDPIGKVLN
ncbi:MAG: cell division protein FtsX, partial [Candidatus Marinimicrobia bacterium CG_4_10_14_0_2_um_filter_48_9]